MLSTFARVRTVAAALVALAIASPALAINITWINAGGGNTGVAGNWNPAQTPVAGDAMIFNLAGTYLVNNTTPVSSVSNMWFENGTVSLDCTRALTATSIFVVAQAGQTATAQVSDGTLNLPSTASVGVAGGSNGTLRAYSDANIVQASGFGAALNVGESGIGALLVESGGKVTLPGDLQLGRTGLGNGTATVDASILGTFGRNSEIVAQHVLLGDNSGTATLNLINGGRLTTSGNLYMSKTLGASTTVSIHGASAVDSARANIAGSLYIGDSFSIASAGTAEFIAGNVSAADVGAETVVGDVNGGSGTLTVRNAARFQTHDLTLNEPNGQLNFTGGTIQVDGGAFSSTSQVLTLQGTNNNPTFEFLNGATATLNPPGTAPSLVVGHRGAARLRMYGNSTVTVGATHSTVFGDSATSDGVGVIDASTLDAGAILAMGIEGSGTMRIRNGGHVTAGATWFGAVPGISGSIDLRDAGSTFRSNGFASIGGSTFGAGGTGSLTVGDGAIARLAQSGNSGTVFPDGSIHVETGGQLILTDSLDVRGGLVSMEGGTTAGGPFFLVSGGRITGNGDMASTIRDRGDSSSVVTASGGALTIGRDLGPVQGVDLAGVIDVGAQTVTLRDFDEARIGKPVLNGGVLNLPAGGGRVALGKSLSGTGTVNGWLINDGAVLPSGVNGLKFGGRVTGTGHLMQGTYFQFLGGSTFEGAGTITGKTYFFTGSTLRPTGTLAIGDAALANGVTLDGSTVLNGTTLNCLSTTFVAVRGPMLLDGGTATAVHPFLVQNNGAVQGDGTIGANLVVQSLIQPGLPVGRIDVTGSVTISGTYACDLGNHATGEHDIIVSTGGAFVNGATLELHRLPTFSVAPGDEFQIMQSVGSTGTFASVTLDEVDVTSMVNVEYRPDGIWVVFPFGITGVGDPVAGAPGVLRFAAVGSPGPRAAFALELPEAGDVSVRMYDVTGREMAVLQDGELAAGRHTLALAGRNLPRGIYFARAQGRGPGAAWSRVQRVVITN